MDMHSRVAVLNILKPAYLAFDPYACAYKITGIIFECIFALLPNKYKSSM